MKRHLLLASLVPALLVLAALLTPELLGRQLAAHRPAGLQQGVPLGQGWSLRELAWSRGWFGSRIRYRLEKPGIPPLDLDLHLTHGPLVLSALAHGHAPLLVADVEGQLLSGDGSGVPLARIHGEVGLGGRGAVSFRLEEALGAGDLRLVFDIFGRHWRLLGHVTKLRDDGPLGLRLGDLRIRSAGRLEGGLPVETLRLSVRQAERSASPAFAAEDLRLALKVDGGNRPGRVHLAFSATALSLPALSVAPAVLRLEIAGLGDSALSSWPALRLAQERHRMPAELARMLGGAQLKLERLRLASPESGMLDVRFEGGLADSDVRDWVGLAVALNGRGRLETSRSWLLRILQVLRRQGIQVDPERFVDILVRQGHFAVRDGVYSASFRLQDGAVEMNGRAVDPLTLMTR